MFSFMCKRWPYVSVKNQSSLALGPATSHCKYRYTKKAFQGHKCTIIVPYLDPVLAVIRGHQCFQVVSSNVGWGTMVDPLGNLLQYPNGNVSVRGEPKSACICNKLQLHLRNIKKVNKLHITHSDAPFPHSCVPGKNIIPVQKA